MVSLHAYFSKVAILIVCLLHITGVSVFGQPDTDKTVSDAEAAMRNAEFQSAVQILEDISPEDTDQPAYAIYVKARALVLLEHYKQAEDTLRNLIRTYPDSEWYHKARCLKGVVLARQRKFGPAEKIYEDEVRRLLASDRKEEIAGLLIELGDAFGEEPESHELKASGANHKKACQFYTKALELAVGRDVRDELLFKRARALQKAGDQRQAIKEYQQYLEDFDPDWTGNIGSTARRSARKTKKPEPAGKHRLRARYRLAEAQIEAGQKSVARMHLEDLLKILKEKQISEEGAAELRPRSRWLLVRSYGFPEVQASNFDKAADEAKTFLAEHKSNRYAVVAAYQLAEAYRHANRPEEAITAYNRFLDKKDYDIPDGEAVRDAEVEPFGKTPLQLEDGWKKRALHHIGRIRYRQKEYERAISAWEKYTDKYPNGPEWDDCQRGMVDAEYQNAVDKVAAEEYDEASGIFQGFLKRHPLDKRAKTILFAFGQMAYVEAQEKAEKEEASQADIKSEYEQAIDKWKRLVSKYPDSHEASLAQFRIGRIYEETLEDHKQALAAYNKLDWGRWAAEAKKRIAEMKGKQLRVSTPRKVRTNEKPAVEIDTRNIEHLTFEQYFLDLESYFRKTHGTGDVNKLDIDLIEPDKTWDVEVADYADYRPLQEEVEIPFKETSPGVCVINVSSEELEATTLVIRSDLELILRSSRNEALVFVQNMLTQKPARDVRVLLSNGEEVFATGQTNEDGVWRKEVDELQTTEQLRVFASGEGHVAANDLNLEGLDSAKGLAPKGYIYTGRSAYKPGQTVKFRGIIRTVKDGSYAVPEDQKYVVSITAADGKTVWQKPMELSEFGTFNTEFDLAGKASVGSYTIKAQRKDKPSEVYAADFKVKEFKLKKLRVALDPDRDVYVRGEDVGMTLRAEYYWGQPAVNKPVRYEFPDGRHFVEHTDDKGEFRITYDTSGTTPGKHLNFKARLEGEDVTDSTRIFLAEQGYNAEIEPGRDVVLSGEPFDARIKTTTPDDQPVGRKVTVNVFRRKTIEQDPVLEGIPWMQTDKTKAAAVKVAEHTVETDADSGAGKVRLTLDEGGDYVLRVEGKDRFKQTITAENTVKISDEDDETKLRFFSKSDTLKVGDEAHLRLHTRLRNKLALLTFEGETIIDYRIIEVVKGFNRIPLVIDHKHFPNFRVAASLIDGRQLRSANKPFEVERHLQVKIEPESKAFEPGEKGTFSLTVTDQLDKPVKAELSLALIDEALFSQYPDTTPHIIDYFQKDARRHAEFRVASTCGFSYSGESEQIENAYLEEAKRLQQDAKEDRARGQVEGFAERTDKEEAPSALPAEKEDEAAQQGMAQRRASQAPQQEAAEDEAEDTDDAPFGARGGKEDEEARSEIPEAGRWLGAIVTDDKGEATAEFEMPEKTSEWRLTSRGCTVDTLVGENTADVVTRKKLFVNLKAPAFFQEGDSVEFISKVHNLTDYSGDGELTLEIYDGADFNRKVAEKQKKIDVTEESIEEALFSSFDIPATEALKLRVMIEAGDYTDIVDRVVPVKPWGLEYTDSAGGIAENSASARVALPDDRPYRSRWMTISVGPELKQSIVEMALDNRPRPLNRGDTNSRVMPPPPGKIYLPGSNLIAAVAAMEYAEQVELSRADVSQLADRARALVNTLIVSQDDDNRWSWHKGHNTTDRALISALNFRALVKAQKYGIGIDEQVIENAEKYLKDVFRKLKTTDTDGKAAVLHALSTTEATEFASLNRLHRQRNSLTPPALAHTALAFANVDRAPMAGELLDILEEKVDVTEQDDKQIAHWQGKSNHPWLRNDVGTTALATLAFIRLRPESPLVEQCINYLLQKRGVHGFGKARGPAVSAIAAYYGKTQYIENDYRLTIQVNGETVRELSSEQTAQTITFPVPRDAIGKDKNLIRFNLEGRGQYSYQVSLKGFSKELKDPKSWGGDPHVYYRKYRHTPLTYRGRSIGVDSSSPVKNIEVGQRVHVHVSIDGGHQNRYMVIEEPIPAGMRFVEGSLRDGRATHHEIHDDKLLLFYPPNQYVDDFEYELVGHTTGEYRVLPTVIRDLMHPDQMRVGKVSELTVLAPGVESADPYEMNDQERFKLGQLYFEDGVYKEALPHLAHIFKTNLNKDRDFHERDVARMLLWIYTSEGFYDAKKIVNAYEVLRERHPELEIPFDKILTAGKAYRDIGEYERAYLIYQATANASFVKDSNVSAVLEDQDQFFRSADYQQRLWREYPDTSKVSSAYFSLSQNLYQKAPEAPELAEKAREAQKRFAADESEAETGTQYPDTEVEMLTRAGKLLQSFLTLYPNDPLADNAAFSMANALLDLKQYDSVIQRCKRYKTRFPESKFHSSFQYITALAHFWKNNYEEALQAAKTVAEGQSKDRDYARYIVAQVYHAQKEPAEAIEWYEKVADQYADAEQSIDYFRQKNISLPEINIFRPDEDVEVELSHRNIDEAEYQVYRVDLMKLYLREKSLSDITDLQLAGIDPLAQKGIDLSGDQQFSKQTTDVPLGLKDEGAYLIICRGDHLFCSGLVLVTSLKIEVQQDITSGRVRVNVLDAVDESYVPEVHVKAIGSRNEAFRSGETDLRGIFVAEDIQGEVTVIARADKKQYAFFRGDKELLPRPGEQAQAQQRPRQEEAEKQSPDFRKNLRRQNKEMQMEQSEQYDRMRRQKQKGVQVKTTQ
ncbi:MAG: tetratricopeptide repeat protein [Planctomycetota bacterium]